MTIRNIILTILLVAIYQNREYLFEIYNELQEIESQEFNRFTYIISGLTLWIFFLGEVGKFRRGESMIFYSKKIKDVVRVVLFVTMAMLLGIFEMIYPLENRGAMLTIGFSVFFWLFDYLCNDKNKNSWTVSNN